VHNALLSCRYSRNTGATLISQLAWIRQTIMLIWALVREGYKGAPGTRYDKERQQSADNSKIKKDTR
jgi:hypothetical protein